MTGRRISHFAKVAATLGLGVVTLAPLAPVSAETADPVVAWIDRHADPLDTTDPGAPLDDLRALRRLAHGATVVGLGESTHGSHEQFQVKHRMVRFLVEQMGYRTVAFEADFASGVMIDRYVVTGEGDPRQLVAQMSFPFWNTDEVLALVEWMRAHNETHRDDVRFLGTDLLQLRQVSFDSITEYVGGVAPDQLDELEHDLGPVRPRGDPFAHMQWYFPLPDAEKQALTESARRASAFVENLPEAGDPVERQYVEQHARAIVGWYANYEGAGFRAEREVFIADSIQWWQQLTGDKVAYWAANAHTTSAPSVTHQNPDEVQSGTMAGGHLEQRLGRRYVSIGTWFNHGAISSDYENPSPQAIGAPPDGMLDATLGAASAPAYFLSLPRLAPRPVGAWLNAPATMRMILPSYKAGEDSAAYNMTVPSLRGAFDALVFVEVTTASHLLTP